MARAFHGTRPQPYPRVEDEDDKYYGYLDESKLKPHTYKIPREQMKQIVLQAIRYANVKSSRVILDIPETATKEQVKKIYKVEGRKLFAYFLKYYEDPASTAYQCLGKHYTEIAREQFRNRTLQKGRMNSGWRYQYVAKEAATQAQRFISVSDIGAAEAAFNAKIEQLEITKKPVNIYVSIKNRSNTLGGQDWPKAIKALEEVARTDKSREGPYLCVFGIAMQRGTRSIKNEQKTGTPYSVNTEVWLSDFFWPFFANYSYDEIVKIILEALMETTRPDAVTVVVPDAVLDAFGQACRQYQLLDEQGHFNDAYRLIDLFCGKMGR